MKNIATVYIDKQTRDLLDNFGKQFSLSRSASVRLIVNNFFKSGGQIDGIEKP